MINLLENIFYKINYQQKWENCLQISQLAGIPDPTFRTFCKTGVQFIVYSIESTQLISKQAFQPISQTEANQPDRPAEQ